MPIVMFSQVYPYIETFLIVILIMCSVLHVKYTLGTRKKIYPVSWSGCGFGVSQAVLFQSMRTVWIGASLSFLGFSKNCCWPSTADTLFWLLSVTPEKNTENQWHQNWGSCLYTALLTFRWLYSLSASCFSSRDGAFSVTSVWPSDSIPVRRKEMPRMFKVSTQATTALLAAHLVSLLSRLSVGGQSSLCCSRSLEISEVPRDHVPLSTFHLPQ